MTKRLQAKYKIDRRLGVNLWGRGKSPYAVRNYGPGQHGKNRKKPTDYGVQLLAKQKLRGYYGNLTERQFHRVYATAISRKGDTSENMIEILERRLDAVVYRMKLASTVFAARQLINHCHVTVNGRTLNIASYSVKDNDVIALKKNMHTNGNVILAQESGERDVPFYIQYNIEKKEGVFVHAPKLADVPYPVMMEPNLVIEYYSR